MIHEYKYNMHTNQIFENIMNLITMVFLNQIYNGNVYKYIFKNTLKGIQKYALKDYDENTNYNRFTSSGYCVTKLNI